MINPKITITLVIILSAFFIISCKDNTKSTTENSNRNEKIASLPKFSLEKKFDNKIYIILEKEPQEYYSTFQMTLSFDPSKLNIDSTEVSNQILAMMEPTKTNIDNLNGLITIGAALNSKIENQSKVILGSIEYSPKLTDISTPITIVSRNNRENILTKVNGTNVEILNPYYENEPVIITN